LRSQVQKINRAKEIAWQNAERAKFEKMQALLDKKSAIIKA